MTSTVKSGSTPVGGPVKSGRKRTKEKGRGLDKGIVRPELVTDWIQRQGGQALIPCIGSGQDGEMETEAETDKIRSRD